MNLNQRQLQTQSLRLRQILTPKMIQMLKTFQSSYADILEKIETEAKDNIALEIVKTDKLSSRYSARYFANNSTLNGQDFTNFVSDQSNKSLTEYLLNQLEIETMAEDMKPIVEALIYEVNAKGYIENYSEIRHKLATELSVDPRKIAKALTILQSFEPEGVGARDLKECLLIQLEHVEFESELVKNLTKRVITDHLEDLYDNQDFICEQLDIDDDDLDVILELIRDNFTPNPASEFGSSSSRQLIVPSFEVFYEDGKLNIINLEENYGPNVSVSGHYLALLNDPETDDDTRAFIAEKIDKAKAFIQTLENRRKNLESLVRFITEKQRLFFEKGPTFLVPLLQKDVASKLTLSSSSISRLVSSKYIDTPHGIYSLKHFCPRNHFGKTKDKFQKHVVDFILKNPDLSDQKVSEAMKKEGIAVARRTVTKYRLLGGVKNRSQRNKNSQ